MKKLILISCAVFVAASPALAREVSTTMTKDQFRLACKSGKDRTYVNSTTDTASCVLADGTIITCNFATSTCTVPRTLPSTGSLKEILDSSALGVVK